MLQHAEAHTGAGKSRKPSATALSSLRHARGFMFISPCLHALRRQYNKQTKASVPWVQPGGWADCAQGAGSFLWFTQVGGGWVVVVLGAGAVNGVFH